MSKFKEGFFKVKQDGGTFICATFFNPVTKEEFSECVRDYDYSDYSRDNDDLYYHQMTKGISIGISICNPLDKFNEEIGINIAKRRINRGQDLGQIETSNVTMLTEDAIMAEILVKLNHICQNIDTYLP